MYITRLATMKAAVLKHHGERSFEVTQFGGVWRDPEDVAKVAQYYRDRGWGVDLNEAENGGDCVFIFKMTRPTVEPAAE